MIIKSIRVQNFRCLKDVTLICHPLTVLVGQNGTGKSCLLHALKLFYEPNASYAQEDFYANSIDDPISITVSFTNLTTNENRLFHSYISGDSLIIEKILTYPASRGSQKYFGWRLKNPDFEPFRQAKGRSDLAEAYKELKKNERYKAFPNYTKRMK